MAQTHLWSENFEMEVPLGCVYEDGMTELITGWTLQTRGLS